MCPWAAVSSGRTAAFEGDQPFRFLMKMSTAVICALSLVCGFVITTQAASKLSMSDNPLTSHVLDTATGQPAANMSVTLHKLQEGAWQKVATKVTNNDGRAGYFIPKEAFTQGTYKMFFDTGTYFKALAVKGFYPYVEIVFVVENSEDHYHVPLLISPYGYSTYRGS